jgi:hypothetical protein
MDESLAPLPCCHSERSGAKNPALNFSADQQQGDPATVDDTPLEYSTVGGMTTQPTRYNARDVSDGERTEQAIQSVVGKR